MARTPARKTPPAKKPTPKKAPAASASVAPKPEIDAENIPLPELQKRIALLKRQKKAVESRSDLLTYMKFTTPDPEDPNDATKSAYIATKLHRAVARAIQNYINGAIDADILILLEPPRHGKSETVSRKLPAWFSGRFPRENIVVATYNDDFAADFGADVRTILQTPQHKLVFPTHKLKRGGGAKDRLQTEEGGMLMFVGRGGSLTGRGAHLLICDDLIKDDKEAASQAIRDQAWNWFTRVAMTRRMGRKLVILTFTRWHADDPIGRLTDPENEYYSPELAKRIKIIRLPALAEDDDDPLGRKPGEALWPERYSEADLHQMRVLDPIGFSSLYQQRPTVEDGILFRREFIRYYDELPEDLRYYAASDHAVATGQRSDRTALIKVGVDRWNNIYVTDVWWKKAPTNEVVEAMLAMGKAPRPPVIWWAEKGHISKSIGPFLRKRMDETASWFNISEVTPSADKEQRAQAISARLAMGHVLFPRDAWWTEKAVSELLAFPNGLHDDFVDAMAYIGLGLRMQVPAEGPRKKAGAPQYGTLGWIKEQQRLDARADAARKYGGF